MQNLCNLAQQKLSDIGACSDRVDIVDLVDSVDIVKEILNYKCMKTAFAEQLVF